MFIERALCQLGAVQSHRAQSEQPHLAITRALVRHRREGRRASNLLIALAVASLLVGSKGAVDYRKAALAQRRTCPYGSVASSAAEVHRCHGVGNKTLCANVKWDCLRLAR
jgi:hypothetical protein